MNKSRDLMFSIFNSCMYVLIEHFKQLQKARMIHKTDRYGNLNSYKII